MRGAGAGLPAPAAEVPGPPPAGLSASPLQMVLPVVVQQVVLPVVLPMLPLVVLPVVLLLVLPMLLPVVLPVVLLVVLQVVLPALLPLILRVVLSMVLRGVPLLARRARAAAPWRRERASERPTRPEFGAGLNVDRCVAASSLCLCVCLTSRLASRGSTAILPRPPNAYSKTGTVKLSPESDLKGAYGYVYPKGS